MKRLLLALAVMTSCIPRFSANRGAGAPPELGTSLNVVVTGDSVAFELHVTNATTQPIALEFATSQRYDVEIWSGSERVWRWSDGQSFAQMVGQEVLGPGESRRHTVTWPGRGRAGRYVARGRLTSVNYPVELRSEFRLD